MSRGNVRCEISFPAFPATQDDTLRRERLVRSFANPVAIHRANVIAEVAAVIAAVERAQQQGNWCVGFVSAEAAAAFDPALVTPTPQVNVPLAWFAEFAAESAASEAIDAASASTGAEAFAVGEWKADTGDADFEKAINIIRAAIHEGDYYQVNYTTRLHAEFAGAALPFFRSLQIAQPRGYQCFIETDEFALASVSPELFFVLRDGVITTQPMKGTTARGDSKEEDDARANYLLTSAKERAENLMIVDLLRNDLSRIAQPATVTVPHLFSLHAYPSVWQMTSTVQARLRAGVGLSQVFAALFPCGSVTGAPKIAAMQAIRALEANPRGIYCGAIGYAAPDGIACFNVGIRSVWLQDGVATCGVGSGITYDSTAAGEAEEVWFKSRFVRRASKEFDLFETIRLDAGQYALLDAHLARIAHSAKHFGFRFDLAQCERALTQVQRKHPEGVWRVKLVSRRDGAATATASELDRSHVSDTPLPVVLATRSVDSRDEFLLHKTTRRESYDACLRPTGFDTLLINERSEFTEFTRANLLYSLKDSGEALFTPPLRCGLLNGTARQQRIALGEVTERSLHRDELADVTRIWWLNGLRGCIEVVLRESE